MPINRPQTFIILVAVLTFVFACPALAESQEDLRELKASLAKQEKQVSRPQAGRKIEGNRGYVAGRQQAKEVPAVRVTAEAVPEATLVGSDKTHAQALYRQAIGLYQAGKLDEAKQNLDEAIELNPLHIPAKRLLKRVLDTQIRLAGQDTKVLEEERMMDVDRAWLPPAKPAAVTVSAAVVEIEESRQQRMIEKKARQVIPEINFTDAHLRDVLQYLSEVSGINIVIDEDIFPVERRAQIDSEIDVTAGDETMARYSSATSFISPRITISLVNIPLIEALKYILSAKGLKFRIDEYAIVVTTPERLAEVEMETRYYHLVAGVGVFTEFVKKVREEGVTEVRGVAKGLEAKKRITIKDVLEESGVPFPPGSKVFLDKRTGTLIVRNTPVNQKLVIEVLRMLDITPYQVEIDTLFVELTQQNASELGLEWMLTNDWYLHTDKVFANSHTTDATYGQFHDIAAGTQGLTHGIRYLEYSDVDDVHLRNYPYWPDPESRGDILSISGILTKPQFKMIIHAMDQSGNANVLSNPKVTTLNNQQAQIEVVDEIIYPTEFELTPATSNDAGTVVTQPAVTPAAFTTRDIGIILNVTPSVGADRKTITLTLEPEVSELRRWEDYGISGGVKWNSIPILQPIFFTKNVRTNVVVHDGETVVLGGLIKENLVVTEDKIPLLGDIPIIGNLFRNKTKNDQKTNLLIFVTAKLMSPTGEHIRE